MSVDFVDVLHYLYKWMNEVDDVERVRLYGVVRTLYRLRYGEDVPDFPGKELLDEALKRLSSEDN